jgi:hypothetical protein
MQRGILETASMTDPEVMRETIEELPCKTTVHICYGYGIKANIVNLLGSGHPAASVLFVHTRRLATVVLIATSEAGALIAQTEDTLDSSISV